MSMTVVNPATGETIKTYKEMTPEKVQDVLEKADAAYRGWRTTNFSARTELMKRAGQVLKDGADDYAELMAREMGKPVKDGRAEANKCAWVCDYYAENAERTLRNEMIETDASRSFVTFQPIGVVLAVMPWTFPFWQVIRFAAPALMAGNAGVLKHASNVPGSALAIEE
ncbi:MAG: aldehyde dehydrogenase family protein, partial [bacterium]